MSYFLHIFQSQVKRKVNQFLKACDWLFAADVTLMRSSESKPELVKLMISFMIPAKPDRMDLVLSTPN